MTYKSKAIFLDRDGVINYDLGHVGTIEDFVFIENTIEALSILDKQDYHIIVVTNQAGIAKGFFKEDDFYDLIDFMNSTLQKNSIKPLEVYFCPHHPQAIVQGYKKADCFDRKPNPGMIQRAVKKHRIDLSKSFIVGDKFSDLMAGKNAGINSKILLKSGHDVTDDAVKMADKIFDDLYSFARWLESNY